MTVLLEVCAAFCVLSAQPSLSACIAKMEALDAHRRGNATVRCIQEVPIVIYDAPIRSEAR